MNLVLLLLGIAGVLYARYHRQQVSTRFAEVIADEARTPADVRKVKEELAEMDLGREQLQHELEGRSKFVASLKTEDFYLSIDTKARKLRLYYGGTMLREADVVIGEARTITGSSKQWTFIPLKGAFPVEAKIVDHHWRVPEWMYVLRNEPIPAERPTIPNGLGAYVIFLPNGYAIHSPPGQGSPLQGAKPGSYMVSEDVLRAIWPRIHTKTQVYIF
ncbi:MAG TPA: L,D-transpeptidase [Thermoanaerobaculia bacterium]|nr:L,D-transpeptidase [Thermoanaerobaculia bacterium]